MKLIALFGCIFHIAIKRNWNIWFCLSRNLTVSLLHKKYLHLTKVVASFFFFFFLRWSVLKTNIQELEYLRINLVIFSFLIKINPLCIFVSNHGDSRKFYLFVFLKESTQYNARFIEKRKISLVKLYLVYFIQEKFFKLKEVFNFDVNLKKKKKMT